MWSLLFVLSIVLAACSSDAGDANNETESGKIVQTILVFGRGEDSTSLDPASATDDETFKVTKNLYETLLKSDEQDAMIVEGLAKEWKTSDDGLTYTFTLREGVKFHDGTDFNAEAVVKNFERWAKGSAEKFPNYHAVFGGFKGEEGHVIESVTADGDDTVIIKLTRPQASFLEDITMDSFAIASPTAFEEGDDEFEENPVGTGPFKFVGWEPEGTITIDKFDEYWQEGLPKLKKVIFRSIPNDTARLNALLAGDIDLADGINPADGAVIEGYEDLQLFEQPSVNSAVKPLLAGDKLIIGYLPYATGPDMLSNLEFTEDEEAESAK